jgi:small-conductance mechanosensitive channel
MPLHRRYGELQRRVVLKSNLPFARILAATRFSKAVMNRSLSSKILVIVCAWLTSHAAPSEAQIPGLSLGSSPAASSAPATPTPAKVQAPSALAIDEIAVEAEEASQHVRDIENDVAEDASAKQVAAQLIPLQRDTNARLTEVRRTLANHPTVDAIHALEAGLERSASDATEATHELTRRADELSRDLAELDKLDGTWQATVSAAGGAKAPAEIQQRAQAIVAQIAKAKVDANAKEAELLSLQGRAADLSARTNDSLDQLANAGERALRDLFRRDSLPVWDDGFWNSAIAAVTVAGSESVRGQFSDLGDYFVAHTDDTLLLAAMVVIILVVMFIARRKIAAFPPAEPEALGATRVFEAPIAVSLVLGCFICYWIYPQPPQLLAPLISMITVIPTLVVVRRVIDQHLHAVMYALGLFFVLERVRNALAVSAPIARLVLVLEIVAGIAYLCWLQMAARPNDARAWTKEKRWRLIRTAAIFGLAIASFALFANVIGYQSLSTLLGSTLVRGAYFALLLYTLTHIVQGLVLYASYVAPFTYLSMVRQHRKLLTARLVSAIGWLAALYWCYGMLESGGLWDLFERIARSTLAAQLTLGHFALSLEKIAGFVIVLVGAYWGSRFLTFVLDEEVYPKVHLERGLPYVISTMLRYVILVVGFIIGLALLGIDMTKFTILAGAFSVGLGFGMQNIVNNFVSGLIVLFERPLKVGDVVQFGDVVGRVERIGIRASVIRSSNGAEVIIPNGTLIANNLTNWTFSSKTRRIDVPIQTVLTADPAAVKAILLDAGNHYPEVAKTPPPQALLTQLGPDALAFELRVWIDAASDWASTKSDLTSAVTDDLRKAGIAIK